MEVIISLLLFLKFAGLISAGCLVGIGFIKLIDFIERTEEKKHREMLDIFGGSG